MKHSQFFFRLQYRGCRRKNCLRDQLWLIYNGNVPITWLINKTTELTTGQSRADSRPLPELMTRAVIGLRGVSGHASEAASLSSAGLLINYIRIPLDRRPSDSSGSSRASDALRPCARCTGFLRDRKVRDPNGKQ
jgi:hypothetical protein